MTWPHDVGGGVRSTPCPLTVSAALRCTTGSEVGPLPWTVGVVNQAVANCFLSCSMGDSWPIAEWRKRIFAVTGTTASGSAARRADQSAVQVVDDAASLRHIAGLMSAWVGAGEMVPPTRRVWPRRTMRPLPPPPPPPLPLVS